MINLKQKYWLFGILILIVIAIIWLIFPCSLPEFSLSYFYNSELTYQQINIDEESKLTYIYFDDTEGKCEFWLYSYPCWLEEELQAKATTLSKKEVKDLIKLIEEMNFMELEEFYGASKGERYYPVELSIKLEEKEKKVIYRSSLDALSEPEAFKMIKDKLFKLINKKFNL